MSELNIEKEAYNYILEVGGEIYIRLNNGNDCCGGKSSGQSLYQIEIGVPNRSDNNYKKMNYKAITIYFPEIVNETIFENNRIILKVAFGGSFKQLVIK